MSMDVKEVIRRISDPGKFTPRGDDYNEPITAWSARAVMELIVPLEQELGDFQNGVAELQRDIDRARSRAGHTEEAGEVCTVDCKGCLDPIGAIIDQMDEYYREMFSRGREVESLRAELAAARQANEEVWKRVLEIASTKTSEYAQAADREIAAGNDSVAHAWELWLKGAIGVRNAIEKARTASVRLDSNNESFQATHGITAPTLTPEGPAWALKRIT